MEIKLGRTRSRRPALGAYMEASSTSSHFPSQPSSHRADRAREYLALHASCFIFAVVTCLIRSRCVAWRFMDSTGVGRPWPSDVRCLFAGDLSFPFLPLSSLTPSVSIVLTLFSIHHSAVFLRLSLVSVPLCNTDYVLPLRPPLLAMPTLSIVAHHFCH